MLIHYLTQNNDEQWETGKIEENKELFFSNNKKLEYFEDSKHNNKFSNHDHSKSSFIKYSKNDNGNFRENEINDESKENHLNDHFENTQTKILHNNEIYVNSNEKETNKSPKSSGIWCCRKKKNSRTTPKNS